MSAHAPAIAPREATTAFSFGTKAQNLAQLSGALAHSTVLPLHVVTVSQWRQDPVGGVQLLRAKFRGSPVIVRSSAPGEDSLQASQAGAFHSVADVDLDDPAHVQRAVAEVIASYERNRAGTVDDHEILVQPMARNVRMSGVVFTRDLDRNAPYYVLNYDDQTARTDTVTSGIGDGHRILHVFKGADLDFLDRDIGRVIRAARELERVTSSDALDIEFAIGAEQLPCLLQVRPLARTRIQSLRRLDRRVSREVEHVKEFVSEKLAPTPNAHGQRGILGEMSDWNPAEIIGTHPKPLAHSLYRRLILDRTWRQARALIGYQDPSPHQLLSIVGGRPYVDVRASFNSFLPKGLPAPLSSKLVEHYLDRLREHPELHDKIEFEIVATCLAFDFDVHEARLLAHGFSRDEVDTLREALRGLTEAIVTDRDGVLEGLRNDVAQLAPRRDKILAAHGGARDVPMVVRQLLEDCVAHGTLPFSVFARCAFIGTSFLRSLVHRSVISEDDSRRYLQGIDTVAGAFVADLQACRDRTLDRATFLSRYGHLRPGTYDICTRSYAEDPDLYLGLGTDPSEPSTVDAVSGGADQQHAAGWLTNGLSTTAQRRARGLLATHGFSFGPGDLEHFIRTSIQLRESVKFEFTKNLSAALDLMAEFGRYHGLTRDDMSFLPVDRLLELSDESLGDDSIAHLRTTIERNRNRFEVTAAIKLPDLICSEQDIEVVSVQRRRPNFIGSKRIIAEAHPLVRLTEVDDDALRDKIVLVENADPGYDWLFGKGIAGLVTKYGGAASHMAIRCAEFGLPAAIGCGEQIYDSLVDATSILLDCAGQSVDAYGS